MFSYFNIAILCGVIISLVCDFSKRRTYNQLALMLGLIVASVLAYMLIRTTILLALVSLVILQVSYVTTTRRMKLCKE